MPSNNPMPASTANKPTRPRKWSEPTSVGGNEGADQKATSAPRASRFAGRGLSGEERDTESKAPARTNTIIQLSNQACVGISLPGAGERG